MNKTVGSFIADVVNDSATLQETAKPRRSDPIELKVYAYLLRDFQSPTAKDPNISPRDYLNWDVDPRQYSCGTSFRKDWVLRNLLRKWKGFEGLGNTVAAAHSSWLASENQCARTNIRLRHEAESGIYSIPPRIISDAQRKVARVLGKLDTNNIWCLCRFGNGATTQLRRGTSLSTKMQRFQLTARAVKHAVEAVDGDPGFLGFLSNVQEFVVGDYDKLLTVPKDAKTDRAICPPPTGNSFLQQGVGRYIRSRLKRFGVDLDDQTVNQDLAAVAQMVGLATLDLKSASDTISSSLVRLLLPFEWYNLLDDIRTHCTLIPFGTQSREKLVRKFRINKFSAMGNAYTFELESLIFWALATSITPEGNYASVYGDDIVVESAHYLEVCKVLEWAGFTINHDKSFTSPAQFYESCGKHYFAGVDSTPIYQKDECRRAAEYIRFHNRLIRASVRLPDLREQFKRAAHLVRREYAQRGYPRVDTHGPYVESDNFFITARAAKPSKPGCRERLLGVAEVRTMTLRVEADLSAADYNEEFQLYCWKLRHPSFSNVSPTGHHEKEGSTFYRTTSCMVWESAVKPTSGIT